MNAVSFSQFMERALYDPERGYYARHAQTPDYYTNVDVPQFADLLALYFYRAWKERFAGQKILIVELGAGAGILAKKTLDAALKYPDFYPLIRYVAVEASAARRDAAKKNAAAHPSFTVRPGFDFEIASIEGLVFSNEFFDALPVNRVTLENGRLREICVEDQNGNFHERLMEPSAETRGYFDWLKMWPAEGCKTEAHPASRTWMEKIAKAMKRGLVLTIDYGLEADELYSEARPEGTLLCHYKHQTNRDFYERIGEQDLTAHVNFTTLVRAGEEAGLRTLSLQTQSSFFLDNGAAEMAEIARQQNDPRAQLKLSSGIKTLIHPEGMGGTFKVLVQEK